MFLQVTCDDAADLPVPGQKYTFGVVNAAQARGDFQVLVERERRALRVHLGADVTAGWADCKRQLRQHSLRSWGDLRTTLVGCAGGLGAHRQGGE